MRILDLAIAAGGATLIGVALWVFVLGGPSGDSQPPASQTEPTVTSMATAPLPTETQASAASLEEQPPSPPPPVAPSKQEPSPPPESVDEQSQPPPSNVVAPPPPPPATTVPPAPTPTLPPAPTATPQPPIEVIYTGTHSGGGSIRLRVSADGRFVELFNADTFCGDPHLVLGVTKIRIIGSGFEWQSGYYDSTRIVSGVFLANGEASGNISYHGGGCNHNVIWTASAQ